MTTAFELASTNVYQPWDINQVGGAYAVYNAQSRVPAVRSAPHAAPPANAQDTATFSQASATLASAAAVQEAREARIAALRQNIADGNYSVSSYRVATSILQSLL